MSRREVADFGTASNPGQYCCSGLRKATEASVSSRYVRFREGV
jgi:hypothetical protein